MPRIIPISIRELVSLLDRLDFDSAVSLADASWDVPGVFAIQVGREEKLLDSLIGSNHVFHYRKIDIHQFRMKEMYFFAENEGGLLKLLRSAEVMFL